MKREQKLALAVAAGVVVALAAGVAIWGHLQVPAPPQPSGGTGRPLGGSALHYAANDNFAGSTYLAGQLGFTMADVESPSQLQLLPQGVRALVWLGYCQGADATFQAMVRPYLWQPAVFGYYLMDDPNPASCSPAALRAETVWIHAHDPGTRTFVILENLSATSSPRYAETQVGMADLYGLDPYPCRVHAGFHPEWIARAVAAATAAGFPSSSLVPVYQAFGLGAWTSDTGDRYAVPTPEQETTILDTWASLLPAPTFDYTYSWGSQKADTALQTIADLHPIFQAHNQGPA